MPNLVTHYISHHFFSFFIFNLCQSFFVHESSSQTPAFIRRQCCCCCCCCSYCRCPSRSLNTYLAPKKFFNSALNIVNLFWGNPDFPKLYKKKKVRCYPWTCIKMQSNFKYYTKVSSKSTYTNLKNLDFLTKSFITLTSGQPLKS